MELVAFALWCFLVALAGGLVGLVCAGVAGALGHLPPAAPDWTVAAVGAAASIPGALLGARLTGRLSEVQLVRAIGAILLVAASAMVLRIVA